MTARRRLSEEDEDLLTLGENGNYSVQTPVASTSAHLVAEGQDTTPLAGQRVSYSLDRS